MPRTRDLLKWGDGKSIKNELRDVCRSHGRAVKELVDDEVFKTSFLAAVEVGG